MDFYIVDVFGESKYSGNQLAVFMNAFHLDSDEMRQIAREINFSETTFIISDQENEGGYDVRIFTPGGEVDFAGHPTLGTAYIIREKIIKKPVKKVILNLKVGQTPVMFDDGAEADGVIWMDQMIPTFAEEFEIPEMAKILGLPENDFDNRYPIQTVSTGLPHVIIPLLTKRALRSIRLKREAYFKMCETSWAKALLAFCPEGYNGDQALGVRQFVPFFGVDEDPATGSGNGCLAGYLVQHGYFTYKSIDIRVGQGYEIGRPSTLYLKAEDDEGHIIISVGGKVQHVAKGIWGE